MNMHYEEISMSHQGSIEKYGRGLTESSIEFVWGDNPKTDGKKIFLPHVPKYANETLLIVHQSHVFHEIGHIEYSDFKRLKRLSKHMNAMHHSIWNSIEDVWMEKVMMNRWNGGEFILQESYRYMIANGMIKDGSQAGDVIPMFVYYTGESIMKQWDVFIKPRSEMRALAVKQVGEPIVSIIETLCLESFEILSSTKDCMALAQAIFDLLENTGAQSQVPSQGEAKNFEKALEQAESESKQESKEKSKAQAKGDSNEEGEGDDEAKGESDDESDEGESESESKSKADSNNSEKSDKAGKADGLNAPMMVPMPYFPRRLPNGNRLAQTLRPILLEEQRKWLGGRKSGRMVGSQLWRTGVDDSRVFRKKRYESDVAASVGLLVDLSGSMEGDCIEHAVNATAELAGGLQHLRVPTGIFGFGGTERSRLSIAKPIDLSQTGNRVYGLESLVGGSTPLTEALEVIGSQYKAPARNKLLFVITDGVPNDPVTATKQIKILQQQGIQTLVINIGDDEEWEPPCFSITIEDASALSSALQSGLKQALAA